MSWGQLLGIVEEAAALDAEAGRRKPVECPNDFTPLVDAGGGILHCPFDGWQYPESDWDYLRDG